MISIRKFLIYAISTSLSVLLPWAAFEGQAHHGKPERLYICKLVASTQMNGIYSGGDGTPEGGQFFGEFNEEFLYGTTIRLTVHGSDETGGYIEVNDPNSGIYQAPIITGPNYVSLPYSPYEEDKLGSQFNTIALLVRYEFTYILNFYRGVLRFTRLGNAPTNEMDTIRHGFADCKYVGKGSS